MPILDMPLHELKTYQGINPRPADIDAFWDERVAAMEALGTDCELVLADFQVPGAQCYHMYFTGMHGARIHARFIRPAKVEKPMPAVCIYHGYSGASPEFPELLAYTQAGYSDEMLPELVDVVNELLAEPGPGDTAPAPEADADAG